MDATQHLANFPRYQEYQGSTSRPSIPRSQTTGPNEIDFSIPDVRPGLARIGRRLTEMSETFLYDDVKSPNSETKQTTMSTSMDMTPKVPFMGDEPVFCPFCDKPLPPALLLQHMTSGGQEGDIKMNPRLAGIESSSMAKTISAPEGSTKSPAGKPHLSKQPSGISASRPTSPISSAQLAANVKEADSVDSAAGKLLLDTDTLRQWAKIAGVELDLPAPPEAATSSTKKEDTLPVKPFPKLAPPPEDSGRSSSRNSAKFSLFGSKGKSSQDEGEDDESDDDLGGGDGYARLDAPASPERVENELPSLKKRSVEDGSASTEKETAPAPVAEPTSAPETASDAEVRELLKEVLTKINEVSKSHASVLHSHSTLLTTLKIARSNLAMAEANAEMLEEQLKRQTTPAAKPPTSSASTRPQTSTSMGPPPNPRPAPIRTSTTGPGAGEGQNGKTEPATPRRSVETSRPQSIQIPSSTNPRTPISASSDSSKGMFGSFWNRNKDKVGEFMSSLPDLTPTAERSSFDFAKSPTSSAVPYGAALPEQYRASPGLNRSKTLHGRVGESETMARSSSFTNVQAATSASGSRAPTDPYTQELTRLRQLHQSSQQKIEAMTKELAEMKKGKVEMEAELENLSQALFEEANKMVADEKKKRVEMEEALKEVKSEREALRDTIKVLGGQVESESSKGDPDEPRDDDVVGELPDFAPRDLDKHYEALRKSIHHVADGTEWDQQEENIEKSIDPTLSTAVPTTPPKARRHSLPDIASPEPSKAPALHDPWADSDTSTRPREIQSQFRPRGIPSDEFGPTDTTHSLGSATDSDPGSKSDSGSGLVSPKVEKLDDLDEMMEKMQADIELELPKKE